MIIKQYDFKEEIISSYNSCNTKKSTLWEIYDSISFREYNADGNTIVFHIFYMLSNS